MKLKISLLCAALASTIILPLHPSQAQEDTLKLNSPIPFKGVATLMSVRRKGKGYAGKARFIQFKASTPVTRMANLEIRQSAIKGVLDFAKESAQQIGDEGSTTLPYEFEQSPSLYFYAPHRLISVSTMVYSFMGGAHGMYAKFANNFGLVPGQSHPRQLTLSDFFRPGFNSRALVQKLLLAKLRATKGTNQEADWALDGSLKGFETAQFNNFAVEKGGLRWFFDPYAVASFAEGAFEVKLTAAELGPNFKRAWLSG